METAKFYRIESESNNTIEWDDDTCYANDVTKNFLQERRWFCLNLKIWNL